MSFGDMVGKATQKAKDLAADHPDKVDRAVEKGGDAVDQRTGGKHAAQVDSAQEKARDFLDSDQPRGDAPRG